MSKSLLASLRDQYEPRELLEALPEHLRNYLPYEWRAWALPEQIQPGTPLASSDRTDWDVWMMLAGRGSGKTRAGSEWVRQFAYDHPGCRIALVARTAGDVRTTMLEGPSGLLSISPPWFMPKHNPSSAKLVWPNGSVALHFSAEEPAGLRGPQFHAAWCDELAAWATHKTEDGEPGIPPAWTQLQYGVRMPGSLSPIVVTTTPKPAPIIVQLAQKDPRCVVTKWTTFDNAANLSEAMLTKARQLALTRLGRQEILAEILLDVPGALWTRDILDANRCSAHPVGLRRVVVAVDPSGGHGEENDEQGIVVAGIGADGHAYVIEDASCKLSPDGWGRAAVAAYVRHGADRIVYEKNFGGEMVEHVIATAAKAMGTKAATREVRASRGKVVRAEPVAALYEQNRVHHIGVFDKLEDQLCLFTPGGEFQESPDRADALVWALTELMLNEPVTLGSGPISMGSRRASELPESMDEEEDDNQWRR